MNAILTTHSRRQYDPYKAIGVGLMLASAGFMTGLLVWGGQHVYVLIQRAF